MESESEGRWSYWIYELQWGMGSDPKASFWLRGTHASFVEKKREVGPAAEISIVKKKQKINID